MNDTERTTNDQPATSSGAGVGCTVLLGDGATKLREALQTLAWQAGKVKKPSEELFEACAKTHDALHIYDEEKSCGYKWGIGGECSDSGWLDMEFAPKQKNILLWMRNRLKKNRIIIARFVPQFTEEQSLECDHYEWGEDEQTAYVPEGWYEQTETLDEYSSYFVDVSDYELMGWAHLPELPNARHQPTSEAGSDCMALLYAGS